MKKNIRITVAALAALLLLASCNDFFDAIPGERYDKESTFTNRLKTEQFLNNVYSYVPDETNERGPWGKSGIWTVGSLEIDLTWNGNYGKEWNIGQAYASSSWINIWYIDYYKGISKASTFITNVDRCLEATGNERKEWKAQARALRALYYFLVFRTYGPCVILGEDPIEIDTPLADLMKERNSVDECVEFITSELDAAARDLPKKYDGSNLGRFDQGACKAFKAKVLLYAASPLFNNNPDYADIKNADGKQLFPQDGRAQERWKAAQDAYEEFFRDFVPSSYSLYTKTENGKIDFYESYRMVTSGVFYSAENKEQIFICLADHGTRDYETIPYHKNMIDRLRGGLGWGVPQEMVDLYFTKEGVRIVDDPAYAATEYEGIPDNDKLGWSQDYNDPVVPSRTYFKANTNKTLKQWANREPRFYTNITFNGSTWLDDTSTEGKVTTELTVNGNSGFNAANWDAPYAGYGMRKMAPKGGRNSSNKHAMNYLRLADMYLGYAETLSAVGDFDKAMQQVNMVRARAGIPGYGNNGGTDSNGWAYIAYPANRDEVDKRIRRERLIELMFEWNHFFDVRRWKVADMSTGDNWIYPAYHRGGEGGTIHGLNYKADAPAFFEKVDGQTRVFDKRHYLLPIPEADVRRNPLMVQNYGWTVADDD